MADQPVDTNTISFPKKDTLFVHWFDQHITKKHLKICRLFIIFLLGFSSGLPLALLTSTLQAWFSISGMSIVATGMLSLLGLPYLLRIFWVPLVDRYTLSHLGKRRSWIFMMQLLLCIGFITLGFCSPTQSPVMLIYIALFLACCSATQDMVIDAHRAEYLPSEDYGLGASLATLGYRLGLLVSGGVALILTEYLSWTAIYSLMGCAMIVGMLAVLFSEEPVHPPAYFLSLRETIFIPIRNLWQKPNIIPLACFIIFFKMGEAFTATTSGIVMPFLIQYLGFSLVSIGYVNKVAALAAIITGGLLAGFLLLRWSLYRALLYFGLLQAFGTILFLLLAIIGKVFWLFVIAVVADNFMTGMSSTALVVLLMRCVDKRYTATQLSVLTMLSTLPRVFSGPIAAGVQSFIGWTGLYLCICLLSFVFIFFLPRIRSLCSTN